jgi:hypothetical protein
MPQRSHTLDKIQAAQAMGYPFPSPGFLFGALLFGILGLAAFRYGKRMSNATTMTLGIVLMVYPYVFSSTWLMYLVGMALCGAIYWFRD